MKFSIEKNGYTAPDLPKWGFVTVYGLDGKGIESLSIDGKDMKTKASFDKDNKVIQAIRKVPRKRRNAVSQNAFRARKRVGCNISLSHTLSAILFLYVILKNGLCVVISGRAARATLESTQHCFLGTQKGKHLLCRPGKCFEKKNQKHVLFLAIKRRFPTENVLCAQRGKHLGKQCLRKECFLVCGGLN